MSSPLNLKRSIQGAEGHPLLEIIDAFTNDIAIKYEHANLTDLMLLDIIRESITAGITLSNTRLGDLF